MRTFKILTFRTWLLFGVLTVAQANDKPVSERPWLRDHLPDKITAYARIPNPMFFFATADTPLKPLYENKSYIQSVNQIKEKLIVNINHIKSLSDKEKQALNAALLHLRAPIEIMVEQITNLETPPATLIATKLDYPTTDAFVSDLKVLLAEAPLEIKVGKDGQGEIISESAPVKVQYEYQASTGKLLITIAEEASDLADIINQAPNTLPSPIADKEAQIDDSGQGLFATLKVHPLMLMVIPREHAQLLNKLGVTSIKEISVGLGIANQRPKFKAIIDMPKTGIRQFIPAYPIATSAQYYGELGNLFSISFPNGQTIEHAVNALGNLQQYNEFKQKFHQEVGIEFDILMNACGRNFTFLNDDIGNYTVTDKEFDSVISTLVKEFNTKGIPLELTEEKLQGTAIKHLNLVPFYDYLLRKNQKQDNQGASAFGRLLMQNHYYWVVEDDAVIMSTLPQPLLARKQLKPTGTLQSVLDKHNLTQPAPFMGAIMNVRNLSQSSYYQQLNLLSTLGDAAGVPVNIAQYPVANTLPLPRYGAISLNIDNSDDQLSVEYSLENGVSDIFSVWQQSGQLGTIGVVGILSAIALPAYHDYTVRAQIAAGIATSAPIKIEIAKALQTGKTAEEITHDQFTASIDAATQGLSEGQFIEVDEGSIYIGLDSNGDRLLILSPEVDSTGAISWICEGVGIPDKQLPTACR